MKPWDLSDRLGHSSVAFTLQAYRHAVQSTQETAARTAAAFIVGGLWDSGRSELRRRSRHWTRRQPRDTGRKLYRDLRGEFDVGMPLLVLHEFRGRPLKRVDDGVVDAQNGILKFGIGFKLFHLYPYFFSLIAVNSK